MRSKIILALVASCASFAFAGTTCNQAAGKQIKGLAVTSPDTTTGPTLGKTFEIKWDPTSGYSTVSILLLKGPSTNVVPFSCIANAVPNNGQYSWSVPSSGIDAQSTGYGIQIIADGSGDFQYSTQFGISSGSGDSGSSGIIAVTSTTRVSGQKVTETIYHTSSTTTTSCPSTSHSSTYHHTAYSSHKIVHHHNNTSIYATAASSGSVKESVTPTKKPSVPVSLPNVGGSGHEITGSPSVAVASSTTQAVATVSKAAGSRVVVLGGGLVAGLGAVAALAL